MTQSGKKKEHRGYFFGSGDRPVGRVGILHANQKGSLPPLKARSLPSEPRENTLCPRMSREFCRKVPDPLGGGSTSLCKRGLCSFFGPEGGLIDTAMNGLLSGVGSKVFMHPMDTIKKRLQASGFQVHRGAVRTRPTCLNVCRHCVFPFTLNALAFSECQISIGPIIITLHRKIFFGINNVRCNVMFHINGL